MKNKAFILFVFLALAADLKVTMFPYIHWIAWFILLFPYMIRDFLKKGIVMSPMFGIATLILMLGMVGSFLNGANLENLIQIIKIFLIFMTLYYVMYYVRLEWNVLNVALNSALIVNAILLVVGILGNANLASLMTSDGRWGTILAYPGSLVKVGTYGFYFNIMALLLLEKKKKIKPLFMLILSIFIIYMDGSRTGMLLIFITLPVILLFYCLINYKNKFKSVVIPIFILFTFLGSMIMVLPMLLKSRIGNSILNLLNSNSISQGLDTIDPARFMMFKSAIEKIHNNPYVGTGAFTTVGIYSDGSNMVVHNTYLQIWGDFGLFGLLGIILLLFGWLVLLPKILKQVQINGNMRGKILVSSSVLMLLYYIGNGLFHPYSTELAEWILFIIPLTYCFNFYKGRRLQEGSI